MQVRRGAAGPVAMRAIWSSARPMSATREVMSSCSPTTDVRRVRAIASVIVRSSSTIVLHSLS